MINLQYLGISDSAFIYTFSVKLLCRFEIKHCSKLWSSFKTPCKSHSSGQSNPKITFVWKYLMWCVKTEYVVVHFVWPQNHKLLKDVVMVMIISPCVQSCLVCHIGNDKDKHRKTKKLPSQMEVAPRYTLLTLFTLFSLFVLFKLLYLV